MSTPMFDVPEHLSLPVNKDGQGPVEDKDADRWVCWCKDGLLCEVVPPIYRDSGIG